MKYIKLDGNNVYPSKIVCVGRNYVEHIVELNNEIPSEAVIFIKPNSSISNEVYFNDSDVIHYEAEISFLIRSGELYAIGFGLDLTKREIQTELKAKGLPWERAKSFDNSAVLSNFIRYTGNMSDLRLELHINGILAQSAGYDLMLNKPNAILNEVKSFLSLEDNDLLMTGTPKGVGAIKRDDNFVGKLFENDRLIVEQNWIVK